MRALKHAPEAYVMGYVVAYVMGYVMAYVMGYVIFS